MSKRNFFASSRIEERARRLDALEEVRVLDGRCHHQIHREPEKCLEILQETEVAVRELAGRGGLEIDEEIEVAHGGIELAGHGGAEDLEAPDATAGTDVGELFPVFLDCVVHAWIPSSVSAGRAYHGREKADGGIRGLHTPAPAGASRWLSPNSCQR